MKRYLPALLIILLGLAVTTAIVFHKSKTESNKQEIIPVAQEVEQKAREKIIPPKELQTDKIPLEWKYHLLEVKKLLFQDFVEQDNDWYDIVGVINNPANKAFVDITGDGIPELMISTAMRPAGGTCYNLLRLDNNKVEFITQIDPMDRRLVETPMEGCTIGNGIYGSGFYFEDKYRAIVQLDFTQNDGENGSFCNAMVWVWDMRKQRMVLDSGMSAIVSDEKCSSLDDFLNGR